MSLPQFLARHSHHHHAAKTASLRCLSTATLNMNNALKKGDEVCSFQELIDTKSVTSLQGIGPVHQGQLEQLKLKTIHDLAQYKFFHLARSIQTLALTEEAGGRLEDAVMNIDKGVDKAYEHQSFAEIAKAPVAALQGISDEKGDIWKQLGVKTVGDLAKFKYCLWAEAIQTAAKFEEEPVGTNDDADA